jgi:hypothetical protein
MLNQQANLDASSTGLKSRSWALNNLRKDKRALALYCRPARYHWSPRQSRRYRYAGSTRCLQSTRRGLNTEYMFWQQVQMLVVPEFAPGRRRFSGLCSERI